MWEIQPFHSNDSPIIHVQIAEVWIFETRNNVFPNRSASIKDCVHGIPARKKAFGFQTANSYLLFGLVAENLDLLSGWVWRLLNMEKAKLGISIKKKTFNFVYSVKNIIKNS